MSKQEAIHKAEQIRDEYRIGANTAERVGNALLAIISAITDVDIDTLSNYFLRKDRKDTAQEDIGFQGGLHVGDFVDSMIAGKGAGIDSQGNAIFESLKVRGAIESLVTIYNKLEAIKGDQVFTDSGRVDDILAIDENTYRLYLHKDTDTDFTSFKEGDILRGSVRSVSNELQAGMAWLRVIGVNKVDNTITAVSYADDQVPSGVNKAPTVNMVLHRWGNVTDEERQSTWYISSTEGRMVYLSDVTKPILEDHNYAAFFGKPVNLGVFDGKPINYNQPYIYIRGLLVQDIFNIDYNGNIIRTIIDRGPWQEGQVYTDGSEKPYQQEDVWHYNCRWRAIVKEATEEPRYNSRQWTLISGDTSLYLDLESSNGVIFRVGQVDTVISAKAYKGVIDITNEIKPEDWSWSRDSGNELSDMAWVEKHKDATTEIHITNEDVGDNFFNQRVKFICTIYYRTGGEVEKQTKTFSY